MKKLFLSIMAFAVFTTTAMASQWNIDTHHTNATFNIRHLSIAEVHGMFPEVSGVVMLNEGDITKSSVNVKIGVASLNTGVDQRDNHLKSADFFDMANFPEMTFKSKKVMKGEGNTLNVLGELTIRGIARDVVLLVQGPTETVTDPWGNSRKGLKAYTVINRHDFGISWNMLMKNGMPQVAGEVNITIDLEMVKAK